MEIAAPAPVTARELDVFERYFADILDAVFDPPKPAAGNSTPSVTDPPPETHRPLDRRGRMR